MERDLREILVLVAAVIVGHAANDTWSTHIGGWQEWAASIGGVLYLSGLIILPVAIIAALIRRRKHFANLF
jgi:uncharacterized membrane protein